MVFFTASSDNLPYDCMVKQDSGSEGIYVEGGFRRRVGSKGDWTGLNRVLTFLFFID